jgi:alkanesulfonate monooxygenase SsuD/methylene tetrahydromethanopterin reductase-like flavin-dependent oxidoreductase (luciferase family)
MTEHMFGLSWDKPVRHLREYLAMLTALLAGQPTTIDTLDMPPARRVGKGDRGVHGQATGV